MHSRHAGETVVAGVELVPLKGRDICIPPSRGDTVFPAQSLLYVFIRPLPFAMSSRFVSCIKNSCLKMVVSREVI